MRTPERLVGLCLVALCTGSLTTALADTVPVSGDHYMCYRAKTEKGTPKFQKITNIFLRDQFEARVHDLTRPTSICLPATKTIPGQQPEPPLDADTHLEAYHIRLSRKFCELNPGRACKKDGDCFSAAGGPAGACVKKQGRFTRRARDMVVNQFGEILLDALKEDRLLVPTSKSLDSMPRPPDQSGLDHFKCYKAKLSNHYCQDNPTRSCKRDEDCQSICVRKQKFTAPRVTVSDQFQSRVFDLKKPVRLCNPVDKNGEGILDKQRHLVCYQVVLATKYCADDPGRSCDRDADCARACVKKQAKHQRKLNVFVNNQFGPEVLETLKEEELCVPSLKNPYDNTQPEITITGVTDNEITNQDVLPQITVSDQNPDTETITLNGRHYQRGTPITAEGTYNLSVTAWDLAGNIASAQVDFTIDKTPPQLAIEYPARDFVTQRALVTVSGKVSDSVGDSTASGIRAGSSAPVEVMVRSPIYDGKAAVTNGQFVAADVVLAAGDNQITAVAHDLAGNISISGIIAHFDPVLPNLQGSSLRVLTYNTAFMSFSVDAPFPAVDFTIDLNDGLFSNLNYTDRAVKIAQGILRGDQDVVVINEAFSDEARAILVNLLRGTYHNYISKLAGPPPQEVGDLGDLLEYLLVHRPLDSMPIPEIPGVMGFGIYPGYSGLMLFSRYPFLPLTGPNPPNDANCALESCGFDGVNNGASLSPSDFAFRIYGGPCGDFDCFASKGVGIVKLDTPERPSYVAFTHLQAFDYPAEREIQYHEVKQALADSVPANELVALPLYMAGDLNTGAFNKASTEPSEWRHIFHPSTAGDNFFACGNNAPCFFSFGNGDLLTDAWGFETSPKDEATIPGEFGRRLDYILHNAADDTLCMQHVMIAWELAEFGSSWYSDHLPMRADLNLKAKRCSANDDAPYPYGPELVEFPDTSCDEDPNSPAPPCAQDKIYGGKITYPGSFQWFKITQPGSYSIKVNNAAPGEAVAFDVYHNSDLSRPISPFTKEEHPDWGVPYSMLQAPYYIRVYAVDSSPEHKPDRTAANRLYNITFHQHLCRRPEDSCFLPPAAIEYPYKWPPITGISKVLDLWFKFKTAGVGAAHLSTHPDSYPVVKLQQEALSLSDLGCMDPLTLEEYDKNIPPNLVQKIPFADVEIDTDNDWHDDGRKDERYVAPDLDTDTEHELKPYYVVMHRVDSLECSLIIPTWIRYETTLSYFIPGYTRCYAQADDSGIGEDDEIRFYNYFDSPKDNPSWAQRCVAFPCYEQDFDEPEGEAYLNHVPSLQGYYTKRVHLDLHEEENDPPDILLETQSEWLGYPGSSGNIETLNPWRTIRNDKLIYADGGNMDDADYWYEMHFVVCHEKEDCRF